MTQLEALAQIRLALQFLGQTFTDDQALKVYSIYPTWDELCKNSFFAKDAGYRFYHDDKLYKTVKPEFTFQSQWVPGVGTESIYERIDEAHAGTLADPIPYEGNMELFVGKYYIQNGIVYRCIRDTGTPVYHELSALVGLYVEVVE